MKHCKWIIVSHFLVPILATHRLHERFVWSVIDYAFISEEEKSQAVATGRYIAANNMPLGIEVWKDKLFVSVPRWKPGVPSTLNFIPLHDKTPPNPLLHPFPDWSTTEPGICGLTLTNVHRIKVDSCDRLWVLDSGTVGLANTSTMLCPFTLNVYDLKTNLRIRKYELPLDNLTPTSYIANIVVDEGHSCEDAFVYLSDELGYGLIVYSWEHNKSWRFKHSFFKPDPLAYDFNVGGVNFQWDDEGIFSMALSPKQMDGFKTLFFSPLTSNREFAVSTKTLKDHTKIEKSDRDFVALAERGPNGHVTTKAMTKNGVQFFSLIDINAIGCWNSHMHPYYPSFLEIVDKDDIELIFISDIIVDHSQTVWVISNRLPAFLYSKLDYEDINFRVLWAPSKALAHGTSCEGKFTPYGDLEDAFLTHKWF